ncbi:MAG: hypothetical protein ACI4BA_03915 [Prevotella sp.]
MLKKTTKFIASLAAALSLTSCLDSPSNDYHQITQPQSEIAYANTPSGRVCFLSVQEWKITPLSSNDWLTIDQLSGPAGYYNVLNVTFKPNTTGQWRYSTFLLQDVTSSDVSCNFSLYQYATRGDGSMGCAGLVKRITGSDGSEIDLTYGIHSLPMEVKMSKNGELLRQLTFDYGSDSVYTIKDGNVTLKSKYNNGFQPVEDFISNTDTVSGTTFSLGGLMRPIFLHSAKSKKSVGMSIDFVNQETGVDAARAADSVRYLFIDEEGIHEWHKFKTDCSTNVENRYQSVDVNQLFMGVEKCDPYCLLGIFRNTRCSYIYKNMTDQDRTYTLEPTLNSDKSVKELKVTNPDGQVITYTFEY